MNPLLSNHKAYPKKEVFKIFNDDYDLNKPENINNLENINIDIEGKKRMENMENGDLILQRRKKRYYRIYQNFWMGKL